MTSLGGGGVVEPMSFDLEKFVSTVKKLATDELLLTHSADVAETARDDYSVESITSLWEKLFSEVIDEGVESVDELPESGK